MQVCQSSPFWCLRRWQGVGALPTRGCPCVGWVPSQGVAVLTGSGCLGMAWEPTCGVGAFEMRICGARACNF